MATSANEVTFFDFELVAAACDWPLVGGDVSLALDVGVGGLVVGDVVTCFCFPEKFSGVKFEPTDVDGGEIDPPFTSFRGMEGDKVDDDGVAMTKIDAGEGGDENGTFLVVEVLVVVEIIRD